MFSYNFMVTTIRAITQELDNFSSEYATQIEHKYVDNRSVADELAGLLQKQQASNSSQTGFQPALT